MSSWHGVELSTKYVLMVWYLVEAQGKLFYILPTLYVISIGCDIGLSCAGYRKYVWSLFIVVDFSHLDGFSA